MSVRVAAGVPTGGQFAASAHAESDLSLRPPDTRAVDLPDWAPPSDTTTPGGAFSRCKEVSAEYTAFLHSQGVEAQWVQVCGPRTPFPDADERWRSIEQPYWQHYVTRVPSPAGDVYVDWTARQFDPAADHPHVTPVDVSDWEATYPLPHRVVDSYLATWRADQDRR